MQHPPGVEHEDRHRGHAHHVHDPERDRERAQEAMGEQPAQSGGDVGADGGGGEVARRPERAPERKDESGGGEEGRGVERERGGGGDGEEPGAERRPDELVGHDLRALEPTVGRLELAFGHHARQQRLRRVVEDGLGGAERERDDDQEGDRGDVGRQRDRQEPHRREPEGVDEGHGPAAVGPVGDRPADQ